jgi:FtsH-binding integral membrane protein
MYQNYSSSVAAAPAVDRAKFVSRTYAHLAGAVLAFVVLEAVLLQTGLAEAMFQFMGIGRFSWLIILGLFMAVSWASRLLAANESSSALQYAGLGLYTLAQAVLFLPIMLYAQATAGTQVIGQAGAVTLALVGGLTAVVFITRKDFSFLGSILAISGLVAMGVIVASAIFGFNLGILFSALMVVFAAGSILYNTSSVMRDYQTHQHVAAALALLSSVLLLFWYVLRLFLGSRRS